MPGRPGSAAKMPPPVNAPGYLGTQTIEGIEAFGTRTNSVIPDGLRGGAPLTLTQEQWFAPELQLTILTVQTNALEGTVKTMKIENLSRIEPDPALFYVPADYTVADEKQTFTIQWGSY